MRVSIVMAAHNEGALLTKTVESCRETCGGLDYEVLVADDCSTDDCIDQLQRAFADVVVLRNRQRKGASPTKDLAARAAHGDVLVFMDAHCKPEPRAIERLVEAVESCDGQAIVSAAIAVLDIERWTNDTGSLGLANEVELEDFAWRWHEAHELVRRGPFIESPSAIGCALAMSRELYERLGGFDPDMREWGLEDAEIGVKSWMLGHPVYCDPRSVVGHRFQESFTRYTVQSHHIVANKLRMACKLFSADLWPLWLERFRGRLEAKLWHRGWREFCLRRASAERERAYLQQNRVHDEISYAARFQLPWPRLALRDARPTMAYDLASS